MMGLGSLRAVIALGAFVAGACAAPANAELLHNYDLNGTFEDSLGGPPLVGNGGSLGASGYTFAAQQGPSLSGALPSPGNYTIEMGVTLSTTSSYRKLIDFANLTSDSGLYNYSTELYFYPIDGGPAGAIPTGVAVTIRLTRNGQTRELTGYVNDVEQFRVTDADDDAVFTGPDSIIRFLVDDNSTSGDESSGGFLDFVRIYSGPETVAAPTLRPAMALLAALLLAGLGGIGLRRGRA